MAEHRLHTAGVAGSTPVAPTILSLSEIEKAARKGGLFYFRERMIRATGSGISDGASPKGEAALVHKKTTKVFLHARREKRLAPKGRGAGCAE